MKTSLNLVPSPPPASEHVFPGPPGHLVLDGAMQRIFALIGRLGPATIPVLLLGETGSGKEVMADWVHQTSRLSQRPLSKINCAGLSESVVESELFGHERGAFTGAVQQHRGVFEAADGGTLFLDEVAELPLRTQAKLLRVLESGELCRLGSTVVRKVQVRLVAATHRQLPRLVESGEFRRDLFFRLNGATFEIPPLRERKAEILPLSQLFLRRAARELGRDGLALHPSATQALLEHDWPGNVRELRNVMDRAAALTEGALVGVEALALRATGAIRADGRDGSSPPRDVAMASSPAASPPAPEPSPPEPSPPEPSPPERLALKAAVLDFERHHILQALEESNGNQTEAARVLGISRRTLTNKLNLHNVARPRKPSVPPSAALQAKSGCRPMSQPGAES
jgi:two-component system response regulator AtoC